MTEPIDLSVGEFRAVVAKAFRGVGYPWGLTEDAAFAVGRVAQCGPDAGMAAATAVLRLLAKVDGSSISSRMPGADWTTHAGPLCPICVGTALADAGVPKRIDIGPVLAPVFIAPLLGQIDAEVRWADGWVRVSAAGIELSGTWPSDPTAVTINPLGSGAGPRSGTAMTQRTGQPRAARAHVDPSVLAQLERYAHRVYAPATDQSRASGAGAGTTDND